MDSEPELEIGQYVGYYWHGKLRYGYVAKKVGYSYVIRDTLE